jgi:subtilisin family serine protease/uncharacterized membrane protein
MRRMSPGTGVLAGMSGVLLLASTVYTQNASPNGRPPVDVEVVDGREAVANEALVRFRRALPPSDRAAVAAQLNADRLAGVGRTGVLRVHSRSAGAASLVAALRRRGDVEFAEPNFIVRAIATPNDPRLPELWGMPQIHAPDAWDISTGSTDVVVAVIDTGIDYSHPDLAANIWSAPSAFTVQVGGGAITCAAGTHGFNAITRTCDPMDDHDHGTHVAGTIGGVGHNGTGVVGVNWTTRMIGVKFLDSQGSGTIADAIDAIAFAIEAKRAFSATGGANIRVLSNSWGGGGFSQAMLDEINAANQEDMLFVAAAGNSSFNNDVLPTYPAGYQAPNVIAVGATTPNDDLAWFSNYGRLSVHLGAPGDGILSTTVGNTYQTFSGTSMATPHVSGAAALVLARCSYDTAALKDALIGTVEGAPSLAPYTITGGRLDVNSAIHSCLGPPPTPTNVQATYGDARVTLTWTASLGAVRYVVKRSTTQGGPYAAIASNVVGTQYVDTAVVNGTTYYYVVSAANSLGESADSSEVSATPRAQSDMIVSSFTAPNSTGPGLTMSVSVTTKNQGSGYSDPSVTRLYLSANSQLDAGDQPLTPEQQVPTLQVGATSTTTLTIPIPTNVLPATYYLYAKADADDDLSESVEANNTSVRLVSIGPDVVVSTMTAPSNAPAGGTASLTWTVKNLGGGTAAASNVRFYLSSNTLVDATDTLLPEAGAVPDLNPGASAPGSTTVSIPANTATGTYYVIATADGDKVVAETSEINNNTARLLYVGGDLTVSALTVPAQAGAGATITVSDTVTNQGSNTVGRSVTRFYLSANFALDAGDTKLDGFREVPEVAANASSQGPTTLTIPAATAPGTMYLIAVADADNTVAETQETNNVLARGIRIGPDLIVSSLTVPSKSGAGASITVNETTKNQGDGGATASVTRFYLSPDFKVDATDATLGGSHQVPALGGGGSHPASITFSIPPNTAAGTYYVLAVADGDQTVVETQELNNVTARLIQIGPDLIVLTASVSSTSVPAGGTVTVGETVVNQGGGAAGGSTTRFYLSVNFKIEPTDVVLAGARIVPPLDAGLSSLGSTVVTVPASTAPGSYYLLIAGDADGAVGEITETNNLLIRSLQVTALP